MCESAHARVYMLVKASVCVCVFVCGCVCVCLCLVSACDVLVLFNFWHVWFKGGQEQQVAGVLQACKLASNLMQGATVLSACKFLSVLNILKVFHALYRCLCVPLYVPLCSVSACLCVGSGCVCVWGGCCTSMFLCVLCGARGGMRV